MATLYFARLILTQRNFTCTQFISHSYDLIISEVKKRNAFDSFTKSK